MYGAQLADGAVCSVLNACSLLHATSSSSYSSPASYLRNTYGQTRVHTPLSTAPQVQAVDPKQSLDSILKFARVYGACGLLVGPRRYAPNLKVHGAS